MAYLLDANIFIQAKNEYYGFDLCPGFWNWLEQKSKAGEVFSIENVKKELTDGQDELSDWAKQKNSDFFLPFDAHAGVIMGSISDWVQNSDYKDNAKRDFLSVADPWLIAYAKAHNHTVVSHEVFNPLERRRIRIPVVCNAFQVPYLRTFAMLRQEEASFILPPDD
ncbi:MAG: DUF4411 family protein [Leptolyngbya sp. SIO3F4]|nr:DUF4411 family protein [Leptolyngbya sp. SIO3F4]